MKIAMLAGYYPPDVRGGGEISTKLLAQILGGVGCEVSVLTCSVAEVDETNDGISIRRIRSPNLYWDFKSQKSKLKKMIWHLRENYNLEARRRVAEFLLEKQTDLLVTSTIENFGAEAWLAAHELGIASVHILRSYYSFCYRGNAVRNQQNCAGQCFDCRILSEGRRRASHTVDGVIGISRYILDRHRLHGFFPSSLSAIIGEPIGREIFRNYSPSIVPRRFGYLGVLSADKGLTTLAEAWNRVSRSGCSLRVAGTGKQEYVDRIKAEFPPETAFLGWVDSSSFLRQLDFLIVPSIWNEPFGRIVIEAFASGVPVIGSRIAGIAETITNGLNGFTYNPGDSTDLAKILDASLALTGEAYRRMSEAARLCAEQYEANLIAAAHLAFYERVIAAKRAGVRKLSKSL